MHTRKSVRTLFTPVSGAYDLQLVLQSYLVEYILILGQIHNNVLRLAMVSLSPSAPKSWQVPTIKCLILIVTRQGSRGVRMQQPLGFHA